MPNIKSAAKRMRQSRVRRMRNRIRRQQMRTAIKRFRQMLDDKQAAEAREFLPKVYSEIDKKARKGVIHKNAAARYKARLTKRLHQLEAEGTAS
ncbi:MAG TPA: 30S ribosomal protein S20 [Acidobacteriota bacterium]|nr:30S ribosomal protein S20 [Acidobacteriota bacterium]